MALFSAEWIAETFDAQVVVVVRHPAAFASSLKLDGWAHPFSHFMNQPALIEAYLEPFRAEIDGIRPGGARHPRPGGAALAACPPCDRRLPLATSGLVIVRHEDLSREPIEGFAGVFEALDLSYTEDVQEAIRRSTSRSNPTGRDSNRPSLSHEGQPGERR